MGQLVRWLMRSDPGTGLLAQMSLQDGEGLLVVDALDPEGGFSNFLDLQAQVIAPDGARTFIDLEQVAPGRYQASFPTGSQGVYTAFVSQTNGVEPATAVAGAVLSYPDEYSVLRPDTGLLHRLAERTGGLVLSDSSPESLRALLTHPAPSLSARPLSPFLLSLALFLTFVDICLRYFPIGDVGQGSHAALGTEASSRGIFRRRSGASRADRGRSRSLENG